MAKHYYIIAIMFSLFSLFGCKKDNMSKFPEHRWRPTESAPKEYVMQIISGHFNLADGSRKGIPTRVTLHNGWGDGRSHIVSGRDILALPESMEITWFSYREDKFYHGKFDLPYEKIKDLHEKNNFMPYSGMRSDASIFTVGVAPEGFVVIWLTDGAGQQVIFTGFAVPVEDVPWQAVIENPEVDKTAYMEKIIASSIEDAKDSPYLHDPKYWQRLHSELYDYDLVIESSYTPYSISARFIDSTNTTFYYDKSDLWRQQPRSILKKLVFSYIFPDRIPVVPINNIDSEEMLAAFRQLSQDFEGVLKVVVTIEGGLESSNYRPTIRVENDKESIAIKNFEFRAINNASALKWLKKNKDLQRFVNKIGQPANP